MIWVFGHLWLSCNMAIVRNDEWHLLWKSNKKIQRKSWSIAQPKFITCCGWESNWRWLFAPESLLSTGVGKRQELTFSRELVHLHWQTIRMLPITTLTISYIEPALTPEQTKSIKPIFSSFQLVPYRPTDDEVVHLKLLGDKDLVDLYRPNPLVVIWDSLVGQKFKHY